MKEAITRPTRPKYVRLRYRDMTPRQQAEARAYIKRELREGLQATCLCLAGFLGFLVMLGIINHIF